jgi:DtxR family transcriptional regulator, manganese transport regulator
VSERTKAPAERTTMAARFARVRQDHAREMAEDYAEMVLELGGAVGAPVRPMELARGLGVSHVTVHRALNRLARDGYILRDENHGVLLTAGGRQLGEASLVRHRLVVAFLESLGVSPEVAAVDAEGLEHHLSPLTLERMAAHMRMAGSEPEMG